MIENHRKGAEHVYRLVSRMDKLIATILIGNTLVNTAIAAIGTILLSPILGAGEGLVLTTILITIVLVVFGELIPKILATGHPERVSFLVRYLVSFFIFIFSPVTDFLTQISSGVIRLFGGNPQHRAPLLSEEEMKMMIKIGKEEGYYGDHERKMLERIFYFDETEVRDVMTPIHRVIAVPLDIKEEELERVLLEEGHNRIPVYRGEKENVVGILYVRDLLYYFKEHLLIHLEDLISVPFFIFSNKKVAELLREFQARKVQIAIVRDPRTRQVIGLVTLEDLMEEIVGEIEEIDSSVQKE
jgi:putative hemolysin